MLKIDLVKTTNGSTALRLERRVIGPWVDELSRSCEAVPATGSRLALDLSDVSFVDRDGVQLFRSLKKRQVALVNYSFFVAEHLRG